MAEGREKEVRREYDFVISRTNTGYSDKSLILESFVALVIGGVEIGCKSVQVVFW